MKFKFIHSTILPWAALFILVTGPSFVLGGDKKGSSRPNVLTEQAEQGLIEFDRKRRVLVLRPLEEESALLELPNQSSFMSGDLVDFTRRINSAIIERVSLRKRSNFPTYMRFHSSIGNGEGAFVGRHLCAWQLAFQEPGRTRPADREIAVITPHVVRSAQGGMIRAQAMEIIGPKLEDEHALRSLMSEFHIEEGFSPDANREVAKISESYLALFNQAPHTELRQIPFITLDASGGIRDDAVFVKKHGNGDFTLDFAVADVDYFYPGVRPWSAKCGRGALSCISPSKKRRFLYCPPSWKR